MDKMFKEYGEKWNEVTEQSEINAVVAQQLREAQAKIEEQARRTVEITNADPGLEFADAGLRPIEQHTDEDRRQRLTRVRQAEKNLVAMRLATKPPEKKAGAYGKRRKRRKRKRKFGKKKKKFKKMTLKKVVKRVGKEAKKVVKGVKKVGGKMTKGVKKIAKNIKEIFDKNSFGRSHTLPPIYSEGSYKVQGYDPRAIVMQSLFGKRKYKFGDKKDGCGCGFGKKRVYRFGKKCIGQCAECGGITGFDPRAISQKKLSYGKRRRKFGKCPPGCKCPKCVGVSPHDPRAISQKKLSYGKRRRRKRSFGKKVSKKPSAAIRRMCKRLKVRLTIKRGKKRVNKSEKVLKKQCKTAMKRKKKKVKRKRSYGKKKKVKRKRSYGKKKKVKRKKK